MKQLLVGRATIPTLPPPVVLLVSLVFVILSLIGGLDWAFGDTEQTVSALMLDLSWGLVTWGLILTGAATWFLVAILTLRHFLIWTAHALLCSVYVGITIATLQGIQEFNGGWHNLVTPVGGLVWHALLTKLMGPLPRRESP